MDLYVERISDSDGGFLYHDIIFELGKLKVVDGIAEIKNRITVALNTYVGENYKNTSFGVDYFNNVYGHEVTDTVTQAEFKRVISGVRGVVALNDFKLIRPQGSRTAEMTAQVITNNDEINFTTSIQI